MRYVDLSHVVRSGMVTYPGLPVPEIGLHLGFDESRGTYASGTEFQIGRIAMVGNTGTYLDTPAHRYREGHDLAGLPLERCAGLPAVVVRAAGRGHPLGATPFAGLDVAGAAVLVHTGWDAHWGTERYLDRDHPHLTEDACRALVDGGAALVGIDSVNIDDTLGDARPAHTVLLGAGIPVVEHLTGLAGLPDAGAVFSAVPVAVEGLATFPVRAFATLD
ncbi:cyclase family protein [Candidatus Blastococcus massiliensis]|uniref:cyclase family protein n=1 Tax=Candidatus Blastococcus massiliensis TaxID=1470358 RepID=UPI0004AF5FB3|nr:cyclase family protein [Candidatus Blastococcus massiliensis]